AKPPGAALPPVDTPGVAGTVEDVLVADGPPALTLDRPDGIRNSSVCIRFERLLFSTEGLASLLAAAAPPARDRDGSARDAAMLVVESVLLEESCGRTCSRASGWVAGTAMERAGMATECAGPGMECAVCGRAKIADNRPPWPQPSKQNAAA